MQAILFALLIGLGGGGFGGYKITAAFQEQKAAQVLRKALLDQQVQLSKAYTSERQAMAEQHATELKNNVVTKEIVKVIPQIQRVKSQCNYSRGTVRLLAEQAGYVVREASSVAVEADTDASEVTGERGIMYTAELLKAYQLARSQCNALIAFVK